MCVRPAIQPGTAVYCVSPFVVLSLIVTGGHLQHHTILHPLWGDVFILETMSQASHETTMLLGLKCIFVILTHM